MQNSPLDAAAATLFAAGVTAICAGHPGDPRDAASATQRWNGGKNHLENDPKLLKVLTGADIRKQNGCHGRKILTSQDARY